MKKLVYWVLLIILTGFQTVILGASWAIASDPTTTPLNFLIFNFIILQSWYYMVKIHNEQAKEKNRADNLKLENDILYEMLAEQVKEEQDEKIGVKDNS